MLSAIPLVEMYVVECLSALARETEVTEVRQVCEDLVRQMQHQSFVWQNAVRQRHTDLPGWVG
jgi:hypothetical protein